MTRKVVGYHYNRATGKVEKRYRGDAWITAAIIIGLVILSFGFGIDVCNGQTWVPFC